MIRIKIQPRHFALAVLTASLLLVASAASAATAVVYNGIDMWKTEADGTSFQDFADDPIPAGFFCAGSSPFNGRITWQGVPLKTEPPGALGDSDTIVHRLDDAIFDKDGVATTRLQVRALSFAGVEPLQTSCGTYEVRSALHGEQPITEMRIVRESDNGGRFTSVLALNVRLTFHPVDKLGGRTLFLDRTVEFQPTHPIRWTDSTQTPSRVLQLSKDPGAKKEIVRFDGFPLVDTDGNDEPDTFIPGTSNFFPGADANTLRELGLTDDPAKFYNCNCFDPDPFGICNCHTGGSYCHCGAIP